MSERKVPKLHLIGVKHKYIPKTFKVTIVRDPYDNCELSNEERKMVGEIACNPYFLTHIVSDDIDTFSFKIVPGGKGAPQIDYTLDSIFDALPAYFIIRDVYIEEDFYSEEDEYFINMRSYTDTYSGTWYSAINFAKDNIEPFSPKDMCFLDLLYQTNRIYETYSSEHSRPFNRINIFDDYIVKDLFYGCLNNIIGYRELADKDNTDLHKLKLTSLKFFHDSTLQTSNIANEFKAFAAEKDIPVISNTHFNNSDLKDAVTLYNLLYEEYEEFAKFQTTKGDNMCNKPLKVITKRQMAIDHVKFSGDRTIIFWENGDKTIVTMSDDVKTFNPEDAIAYGYMKRVLTLFGDNAHEKSMKEILDRWAVEEYNLNAKQHKKDLKRIKERKAKKKEKETE